MDNNLTGSKPQGKSFAKFIIPSLIGVFLFICPIPSATAFNIPLGVIIDWITALCNKISFGVIAPDTMALNFGLQYMIGLICVTIATVGSVLATVFKLDFIMSRPLLKRIFYTPSPIYFVSKLVGFCIIWMLALNIGPKAVIASYTGDVMIELFATLVCVFLILVPGIPLLTDFGLMEFIGIFIKKFVRTLFTLPGRASVDLAASWFGSSVASVIITRTQHEKGFYTHREAACATTNFAMVSVPFSFVVARTANLADHFFTFYFLMSICIILLAVIMPRIWPLRSIPDTYLEDVGKQFVVEEAPANTSRLAFATRSACERAEKTTFADYRKSTASTYANLFLDLLPIVLAWGTVAMMINELTPIFDYIAWPMAQLLNLMQVEAAAQYAPFALVGFLDMFIPALMIGDAPIETRMILGVLSVVQVVYMSDIGTLILRSRIPLKFWHLLALFAIRTIIALPIIVVLVKLIM